MTILQRLGQVHLQAESLHRAAEFLQVARAVMLSPGGTVAEACALARQFRATERVLDALTNRAAAPVGSLTDSSWAAPLGGYSLLADGFLETLRNVSAF